MNVCILTSSHSTFDSRIFHKQARSLADSGHDVTIITPHECDTTRFGVSIRGVGGSDVESAGFGHAWAIYREARAMDADVYHFHDPGLLPFGLVLSIRTDARVIYDCHEQYENALRRYSFPPDILNPLVSLYPTIQSTIANRLDAVVTTTEAAAAQFRDRGHSNVVAVRNFPVTAAFEIDGVPLERSAEHVLVYVGSLDEVRGLTPMLRLLAALRERGYDVEGWFIGSTEGAEGTIERRTAEFGIDDHVTFTGRVPHEEIFSYLAAGDVGLALLDPDRFEQDIPLKLFEYMYAGIPVVTTPIGAASTFVEDDWGMVVPFDELDIQAEQVAALLDDPERIERMGRWGREAVESRFSWEIEQRRLLDLYASLEPGSS